MNSERPFFEENAPADEAPAESSAPAGDPGAPAGAVAEPTEGAVRRLTDQLAEANDRYIRLAADFDNFRRRSAKERIELSDRAQAAFVLRLLEVLDDLDRLAATDPAAAGSAVRQAVEMVDRKLRKELEQAGLERIDPVGARFDPTEAEAVSVIVPPSEEQDHLVSATFQVGYRFKGNLVRPARVQVYSSEGHA